MAPLEEMKVSSVGKSASSTPRKGMTLRRKAQSTQLKVEKAKLPPKATVSKVSTFLL